MGYSCRRSPCHWALLGAIYESRPNVTFDIAALCLRSQNGALLKGSSEAENTNQASIRSL